MFFGGAGHVDPTSSIDRREFNFAAVSETGASCVRDAHRFQPPANWVCRPILPVYAAILFVYGRTGQAANQGNKKVPY
jgi:hypothetical protein